MFSEESTSPDEMLTKLCDIILQLSNKVEALENKIDVLTSNLQSGFEDLRKIPQVYGSNVDGNLKHPSSSSGGGGKKTLIYTPDYVPSIDFYAWIQTCIIKQEHVNAIFKCTILEGFKYFINDWFSEQHQSDRALPIVVLGSGKTKLLYVFEVTYSELCSYEDIDEDVKNDMDIDKEIGADPLKDGDKNGKWVLISDKSINQFITSIWRKMLEYYFTREPEPGVDETIRDINKKKLIDMRKGLAEKHIREIERSIVKVLQK